MEKSMIKPPMPNAPGVTDSLDFVKNLWGNMNVPGITGPALGIDELEKRISDLKAVEAWLGMNMTMLRGTIQMLEVQRGTVATLKAMSASMSQAMSQAGAGGAPGSMPFQNFFAPPGAPAPGAKAPATPQGAAPTGAGAELPPGVASMPAAVAWWNVLQDQFKQAVASTMSPEAMASATAMAQDAAARFSAAATPPDKSVDKPADKPLAKPGNNGKPKPDKT
jgi:hypothetical protein